MPRDLNRLLRPRSIAVLGSGWAENVIEQCDKIGFAGKIWPVHPTRAAVGGRQTYSSISDLPGAPDATFVGINRNATVEVVRELSVMGAGGAVCFASGWAETGAEDLQSDLVTAAGAMPILGPNCYGVLNMLDRSVIWPDQHGAVPCDRGVAILSQSSNIAINLTMQARGLPIAYVACLGNAAQTDLATLAAAMLDDDRVTALGLYIEGIDDAVALADVVAAARFAGKGVVALKTGRSEKGAAAAASHTAALSGTAEASQAYLAQIGVGEVSTPAALIEALKILHVHGPLKGRRMSSLSCSGGEAGLVSDLSKDLALEFPDLTAPQEVGLAEALGPLVALSNPLDYNTYIWGDLAKTTAVFTQMLAPVDAGVFVIDPPRKDRCDPSSFEHVFDAIDAAQTATGTPAFPIASMAENSDETRARDLMERDIVPLMGLDTGLEAVQAAGAPLGHGWRPWPVLPARETEMLNEAEGKALLSEAGVAVPCAVTANTLDELARKASGLTAPLALKGLGFAHKSEAGAVRLHVMDLSKEKDMPGAQGYLAEEMVTGVVAEMIIGLRRDPVYGATCLFGFGGVEAELLQDTVTLVLPVDETRIRIAIESLKLAPLLHGYRGRPTADVDAVIEAILNIQSLLAEHENIEEIEINPLMVRQSGAVAADALIRKDCT